MKINGRTGSVLGRLPPPPHGRVGWPWTEDTLPLPDRAPDGRAWPKITIVTPTLNQGTFLEETIRSVLLQGYPCLEYMVIDGGSCDGTLDIVRKYADHVSWWISETDRGQTHAINKGLARATGELFNWLNSDDSLMPDALLSVATAKIRDNPDFIVGEADFRDHAVGHLAQHWGARIPTSPGDFVPPSRVQMAQPATFISRDLIDELGPFREELLAVMDYEFYLRATLARWPKLRMTTIDRVLASITCHPATKSVTMGNVFTEEWASVLRAGAGRLNALGAGDILTQFFERRARQHAVTGCGGTLDLIKLPVRAPAVLRDRFYWGAVRQRFLPRHEKRSEDHEYT